MPPASDPTTLDDVLDVLKREKRRAIGETPPGSNRNEYTRWFYGSDLAAPWCAIYQCWVEDKAGGMLMPKTAYTPTMAQFFIDNKRFGKVPRLGALAFFDFPDSLPRIQHVGRVVDLSAGRIVTNEGNTSSGTSGSQDDGGNVYERIRNAYIVGYGYPAYEKDLPRFHFPKEKTWFGAGDSGADVKLWQIDLNRWIRGLTNPPADFRLEITRRFDPPTSKATKTFQAFYDLDVDGRVGQHTLARMERIRLRQTEATDG